MENQAVKIAQNFKGVVHASKVYMKKNNVHAPEGQNLVLIILSHHNLLTPTEIGRRMNIRSAAVAELLNKLEKNGFVKRVKDKDDLRKTRVEITEKGLEKVMLLGPSEEIINGIFSGLTKDELDQLDFLINKLLVSLEEKNYQ